MNLWTQIIGKKKQERWIYELKPLAKGNRESEIDAQKDDKHTDYECEMIYRRALYYKLLANLDSLSIEDGTKASSHLILLVKSVVCV